MEHENPRKRAKTRKDCYLARVSRACAPFAIQTLVHDRVTHVIKEFYHVVPAHCIAAIACVAALRAGSIVNRHLPGSGLRSPVIGLRSANRQSSFARLRSPACPAVRQAHEPRSRRVSGLRSANRQSSLARLRSPVCQSSKALRATLTGNVNHQSSIANHQSPIANRQSPIVNRQSSISHAPFVAFHCRHRRRAT